MKKGFILTLVLAVIGFFVFLFILTFVYIQILGGAVKVAGEAMKPNYVVGQNYLVNIFSYKFTKPQRGDVVVIKAPNSFFRLGTARNTDTSKVKLLKRIIGLPGETVDFKDGYTYINDKQLDEMYLPIGGKSYGKRVTIPPNSYFLLGDNRTESSDSRIFGSVSKSDVVGKLLLCYSEC